MDYKQCFNTFVGGVSGAFKGVNLNTQKIIVKNIQNVKALSKEQEITAMAWGDSDEHDVLIGLKEQRVKIYDCDFKAFSSNVDVKCGVGAIRGLSRFDESLVTGVESGHVKVWKINSTDEDVLETGNPMSKMAHSMVNRDIIATGGKGNDLKLWNLRSKENTFIAKNVKHDYLELEVPVWVSDIAFLRDSAKVAICSRYGQVRLYDPSSRNRRPVINVHLKDEVLTCLALASREHHVVVGSGSGSMILVDLRNTGQVLNHYKGFVGGIRSIACHTTKPYIVSCGLDRHIRVHNLDTKALLCKEYLKSKLNCLLIRDSFSLNPTRVCDSAREVELIEDEYDDLFDNMPRA